MSQNNPKGMVHLDERAAMSGGSVWRRSVLAVLVVCTFASAVGCAAPQPADPSCTDADASELQVTGDAAPAWADIWLPQAGGALGGGWIGVDDEVSAETFERVYTCVGLQTSAFREITGGGKAPEQRDVRVGVSDYLYRAGDVTTAEGRFSVDVAVARTGAGSTRFGVAFAPHQSDRAFVDVYAGAFVVQQMRQAGIF